MRTVEEEILETLKRQTLSERVRFDFVFSQRQIDQAVIQLKGDVSLRPTSDPKVFTAKWAEQPKMDLPPRTDFVAKKRSDCINLFNKLTIPVDELNRLEDLLAKARKTTDTALTEISIFIDLATNRVSQFRKDREVFLQIIEDFFDTVYNVCPYEWRDKEFAQGITDRFIGLIECVLKLAVKIPFQGDLAGYFHRMTQLMFNDMNDYILSFAKDPVPLRQLTEIEMAIEFDKEIATLAKSVDEQDPDKVLDRLVNITANDPNFDMTDILPLPLFGDTDISPEDDQRRILYNAYEYTLQKLAKRGAEAKLSGNPENVMYVQRCKLFADKLYTDTVLKIGQVSTSLRAERSQGTRNVIQQASNILNRPSEGESDVQLSTREQIETQLQQFRTSEVKADELDKVISVLNKPGETRDTLAKKLRAIYYLRKRYSASGEDFPELPLPKIKPDYVLVYRIFTGDPEVDLIRAIRKPPGVGPDIVSSKSTLPDDTYAGELKVFFGDQLPSEEVLSSLGYAPSEVTNEITLYRADPRFEEKESLLKEKGIKAVSKPKKYTEYTIKLSEKDKDAIGFGEGKLIKIGLGFAKDISEISTQYLRALQLQEPWNVGVGGGTRARDVDYYSWGDYIDTEGSELRDKMEKFLKEQVRVWRLAREDAASQMLLAEEELVKLNRQYGIRPEKRPIKEAFTPVESKAKKLKDYLDEAKTNIFIRDTLTSYNQVLGKVEKPIFIASLLQAGTSLRYNLLTASADPPGPPVSTGPPVDYSVIDPTKTFCPVNQPGQPMSAVPTMKQVFEQSQNLVSTALGLTGPEATSAMNSCMHNISITELVNGTALEKIADGNLATLGQTFMDADGNIQLLYNACDPAKKIKYLGSPLKWEAREYLTKLMTDFLSKKPSGISPSEFLETNPAAKSAKQLFMIKGMDNFHQYSNVDFDPERLNVLAEMYNRTKGKISGPELIEMAAQLRLLDWEWMKKVFLRMTETKEYEELVSFWGDRVVGEYLSSLSKHAPEAIKSISTRYVSTNIAIDDYLTSPAITTAAAQTPENLNRLASEMLKGIQKIIDKSQQGKGLQAPLTGINEATLIGVLAAIVPIVAVLYQFNLFEISYVSEGCVVLATFLSPMIARLRNTATSAANMGSTRARRANSPGTVEELRKRANFTINPNVDESLQSVPEDIPDELRVMVERLRVQLPRVQNQGWFAGGVFRRNLTRLSDALVTYANQVDSFANDLEKDRYRTCLTVLKNMVTEGDSFLARTRKWGSIFLSDSNSILSRLWRVVTRYLARRGTLQLIISMTPVAGAAACQLISWMPDKLRVQALLFFGDVNQWTPWLQDYVISGLFKTWFGLELAKELFGIARDMVDIVRISELTIMDDNAVLRDEIKQTFQTKLIDWALDVVDRGKDPAASMAKVIGDLSFTTLKENYKSKWLWAGLVAIGSGGVLGYAYQFDHWLNPSLREKILQWLTGVRAEFPVPSPEEAKAEIIALAQTVIGSLLRVDSPEEVDARNVLRWKRVVALLNNIGAFTLCAAQAALTMSLVNIPFVRKIASEIHLLDTGFASTWSAMRDNIGGSCMAWPLTWFLKRSSDGNNALIKYYAEKSDVYAKYSLYAFLEKRLEPAATYENALDRLSPILTGIEDLTFPLPEDVQGMEEYDLYKQKYTRGSVEAIFGRDKLSKMTVNGLREVVGDKLEWFATWKDIQLKLVYANRSFRVEDIEKKTIEVLGTNPETNQYLKLYNDTPESKKGVILKDIRNTWHFWSTLIKEQERQFQILVDVAEEILGVEHSPLSPWRKGVASGLTYLDWIVSGCMLGNWVGLALQMFVGVDTLREYGIPFPVREGGAVRQRYIIEEKMNPIENYRKAQVVTETYPPNIIAQFINQMNDALSQCMEAIKQKVGYQSLPPEETPCLNHISEFFRTSKTYGELVPLKVEGLEPTLTIEEVFNEALTRVFNTTREAFNVMAVADADACVRRLRKAA